MCTASVVYQYGRDLPPDQWTDKSREAFRKLIRDAMDFDKTTGQPDCEDSEKKKWWSAIEEAHK